MKLVRVKGKGQKWKKGQSCVSNAPNNKHREAAKGRFFEKLEGASDLTTDALAQHNQVMLSVSDQMNGMTVEEEDLQSQGKTFNTFATNFTSCTLPVFNKFFNQFDKNSDKQKRMLAIHAALQEYMNEQNIPETNESYALASLVSARGVMDCEEDIAATILLLARVIRKVPAISLRKRFEDYATLFSLILIKYKTSEQDSFIASIIGCISVLLRALDINQWKSETPINLLQILLRYSTDERHKIRKSAQYNISAILKGSSFMITVDGDDDDNEIDEEEEKPKKPFIVHPGSVEVMKFIESLMCSTHNPGERKQTLHVLVLLRQIIVSFPRKQLKKVCEWVLSMMQLGDNLVNITAMQVLYNLFISEPTPEVLTSKTNLALLNAMTSNQGAVTASGTTLVIVPNMNERENSTTWISVVSVCLLNYYNNNEDDSFEMIESWFKLLTPYWKSDNDIVQEKVYESVELILEKCVAKSGSKVTEEPYRTNVSEMFKCLETSLSLQYQLAWDFVFKSIGVAFMTLGNSVPELMTNCLRTLCEMVNNSEIPNKRTLEHVIGNAIQGLGPKAVVDIVPFQITGNIVDDEKYFWILPLLKKYVKETRLSYFVSYFLPSAKSCFVILQSLKQQNKDKTLLYKTYQTIELQIWSMLPSFADHAIDIEEAIANEFFPRQLREHINKRDDTRLDALLTLRNMINNSLEKDSLLQKYAKNYLPILFNIYRSMPLDKANPNGMIKGHRLAAYETIKTYLQIVPKDKCHEFFELILKKFEDEIDSSNRETLLDLARAFLPFLDPSCLAKIYQIILEHLSRSSNKQLQKSTYKLLEGMLGVFESYDTDLANENIQKVAYALTNSLSTTTSNCRAPRLRCLRLVFKHLTPEMDKEQWRNFLKQCAGEIIMCCGGKQSEATRKAAFLLLSELGAAVQIIEECSGEDTIRHCLKILLAGLNGPPSLVSNTILALTSLSHTYKEIIPTDNIILLLENVISLITSNSQEVIESCLSFMKSSIRIFHKAIVSDFVDRFVFGICNMPEQCQRKLRLKTRDVFSMLIRKFGADRITALIPESNVMMQKRIRSLRKIEAKRKRNQEANSDSSDDDSDDEPTASRVLPATMDEILQEIDASDDERDESATKKKNKKDKKDKTSKEDRKKLKNKKKIKGTWIKEDDEEIIDLLDASASQNITSKAPTDPQTYRKKDVDENEKPSGGFSIDEASGKLIIVDSRNDKDKKDKNELSVDDYDAYMQLRTGALQGKIKKRKRTNGGESSDEENVQDLPLKKSKDNKEVSKPKNSKHFDYGAEFRSKKSGGDVKLKGKADPYAYVPFHKDRLNKRKKAKYAGQLKTLVKGAKRGATKGTKMRNKKGRK